MLLRDNQDPLKSGTPTHPAPTKGVLGPGPLQEVASPEDLREFCYDGRPFGDE